MRERVKPLMRITLIFVINIFLISCAKIERISSNDTSSYLVYEEKLYDGGTPIAHVFPKSIENVSEVVDYHYIAYFPPDFRGTFWELVLIAKYNENEFAGEINRLSSLSEEDDANLLLDENHVLFKRDAFIETYNVRYVSFGQMHTEYSYALIDYDNFIISYIYINNPAHNHHELSINDDLLPMHYKDNLKKKSADNLFYGVIENWYNDNIEYNDKIKEFKKYLGNDIN